MDATMEIEVLSETSARGTMTMSMDKEFYDMAQASEEGGDFCEDGDVTLTEDTAICTSTKEGSFDELAFDEGGDDPLSFTSAGPGLVRVAFPTGNMQSDMSEDASDPQTAAMMKTFFEGHFLTLRVGGGEITETNMTLADDGMSAELVIPFEEMMTGEADLPDEAYAIVKVR
jgi:hypothetical protein